MTKKLLYLLCFVLVLSLAGNASAEEAIVWDGTGSTVGCVWMGYNSHPAEDISLGNMFEVDEEGLAVTALGIGLADGSNPPTGWHTAPPEPYTIELWEVTDMVGIAPDETDCGATGSVSDATLLASVAFSDGNMGYEQGIFNYKDIDPVDLVAGTSYQVVEHLGTNNPVWWGDIAPQAGPGLTLTGSLWGFPGTGNFLPNIEPAIRGFTVGPTMIYGSACPVTVEHSEGKTEVAENGATTDSFTVVLYEEPNAPVTLTLDPPTDDVKLNGAAPNAPVTLTFETNNWDTPQTVTVMANDDAEGEGEETHRIDISLASTDVDFVCSTSASVTVLDDDQEDVLISESDGATEVAEEGMTTDTYEVVLVFGPNADVTITVLDTGEPNQVTLNGVDAPLELTFTAGNWDTPQTVTVKAIDDGDAEEHPHTTSLSHSVSQLGGNQNYNGLSAGNVEVSISENDCGAGPFDVRDYDENCITDLSDFAQFSAGFLNCSIGSCI